MYARNSSRIASPWRIAIFSLFILLAFTKISPVNASVTMLDGYHADFDLVNSYGFSNASTGCYMYQQGYNDVVGDPSYYGGGNWPCDQVTGSNLDGLDYSNFNLETLYTRWNSNGLTLNNLSIFIQQATGLGQSGTILASTTVYFHRNGSNDWSFTGDTGNPPPPTNTTTRFTSISISTSTQTVNVQGYWNLPTATSSYQDVEFYQESILLGVESYTHISGSSTGTFNFDFPYRRWPVISSTSTNVISSLNFYANINEYNQDYYNPFGDQNPLYRTLLASTSTSLYASGSIASSTDVYFIGTTTRDIVLNVQYDCDLTHLGGCILNAGIALFAPTQSAVDNFNNLRELMKTKAPWGYWYTVNDNLKNISATTTPIISVTIPSSLRTYIFSPFDIGIAGILWFFFLINFYKRFKHVQL